MKIENGSLRYLKILYIMKIQIKKKRESELFKDDTWLFLL